MRLALGLFVASAAISLLLTAFAEETRAIFVDDQQLVVIGEPNVESYLTLAEADGIVGWREISQTRGSVNTLDANDPALFFNTYLLTNAGDTDIINGKVQYDLGFSEKGLIGARVRAPLPRGPIGEVDPRRLYWNEFEKQSEGKFSYDVPLFKPGETIAVQIVSDEFGAVVPYFRGANVEMTTARERMLKSILEEERRIDWIGIFRTLFIVILVASAFWVGRTTRITDANLLDADGERPDPSGD